MESLLQPLPLPLEEGHFQHMENTILPNQHIQHIILARQVDHNFVISSLKRQTPPFHLP